ncbi:hypothetical protein RJ640_013921 [Escallonia rubra]|uniref:RING-type domain-containing protein n=1 Tax=Escallonia rubra TaxID=112253 RepID=A0AA88R5A8_9ASTE|nr:hypothetical protein RJ640_013921 [Escallonia rubra]
MGQKQSKDELLYQQVNYGNTEGIKALRSEGAGLEWFDSEGKTPLIVACMNPELYNVAKTLIELGANVNAYRPGRHAGTPLHHAAKRGLEQTVKLLLTHGANALVMNDDCQTPLDVARVKGYSNVVRAIESHICLFAGWLRELYGPGFLELLAPQLLSRKVWVVVLPCGSRNLSKPFKLELAIYSNSQDAKPRALIALWKANMEEPKFNQPDPAVIISDFSNIPRRWRRRRGILSSEETRCKPRRVRQNRIKLAPAKESDKQQLQWFCNACKGIPQVVHPSFPFNAQGPVATAPPTAEDAELAMAINASLQFAAQERPQVLHTASSANSLDNTKQSGAMGMPAPHKGSSSGWEGQEAGPYQGSSSGLEIQEAGSHEGSYNGWEVQEAGPSNNPAQHIPSKSDSLIIQPAPGIPNPASMPSAPPIGDTVADEGPIQYPSIDSSPVDVVSQSLETLPARAGEEKEDGGASSSCVICLDAPVEGACIPCGHMVGCMSCLSEIKAKKWGCPVCRTKIDQVIRLYAV